jgi:AcrR family transcriptional regulator
MESLYDTLLFGYADYIKTQEESPASIAHFCRYLGVPEGEFYAHFASFEALERAIWLSLFTETIGNIVSDEVYNEYSVREKLLSFYYTWIEVLKEYRYYVRFTLRQTFCLDTNPAYLRDFEGAFRQYADALLVEARETEEFPSRMGIEQIYAPILWLQAKSVLKFWADDESPDFEKTDAYIDKNVNFTCDSFSRSFLDSAFDYFKFLFQA